MDINPFEALAKSIKRLALSGEKPPKDVLLEILLNNIDAFFFHLFMIEEPEYISNINEQIKSKLIDLFNDLDNKELLKILIPQLNKETFLLSFTTQQFIPNIIIAIFIYKQIIIDNNTDDIKYNDIKDFVNDNNIDLQLIVKKIFNDINKIINDEAIQLKHLFKYLSSNTEVILELMQALFNEIEKKINN